MPEDSDVPEVVHQPTFEVETLGPYVSAAATLHGQGAPVREVVATALELAIAAETSGAAAVRQLPIRSYEVDGILSIGTTSNPYRTQIGIATAHGIHGPDMMWTISEEPPVALRTRAVLSGLVGRRVVATKETFYERHADGTIKRDGTRRLTRTRLAPGSLHVVGGDGQRVPVDLSAGPARGATVAPVPTDGAATTGAKPPKAPFVDGGAAYAWLVERFGASAAAAAWGAHPKTGPMARETLEAIRAAARRQAA